jgi:hypothetical protein
MSLGRGNPQRYYPSLAETAYDSKQTNSIVLSRAEIFNGTSAVKDSHRCDSDDRTRMREDDRAMISGFKRRVR